MRFKRSQAALEFLTTYGWAILVVLVMIGALAYFGVLNPSKFAQERCAGGSIFSCSASATTTNITLELTNQLPEKITVDTDKDKWSVKLANGTSITVSSVTVSGGSGVIQPSAHKTFTIDTSTLGNAGDKVKIEIQVPYTRGESSLTQKATVEVITTLG
ncbi:hypothetical protein J7L02_01750 [Candidatus Woesearchaeota archaeon]|nr:hypothetical protein [Candidatus Woesearchaeota archaeon]